MTFGDLMYRLNELYVGNERDFRNMPVMVSRGGIIAPMGGFSCMNGRIVFDSVSHESARESYLGTIADELGRMNRLKAIELKYGGRPEALDRCVRNEMGDV